MAVSFSEDGYEKADIVPKPKVKWYKNLTIQVVLGIVLGIFYGYFFPESGIDMKVLGDVFIKLIKMVIGPIVFLTIVTGISGIGDVKKVGKLGVKSIVYFEIVTTIALILGMVVVNIAKPGEGMNTASMQHGDITKYTAAAEKPHSTVDFLVGIIPDNMVSAFAEGNLLQVLLVAVLFGVSLAAMGEKGRPVEELLEKMTTVIFGIINIIMKLAPIGAFGAIAFTIGKYGLESLIPLGKLIIVACIAMLLFIFGVLGLICKYYGFSISRFIRYIKDELFIVLGTASSETVLPKMMEKMQRLGCAKPVVGLVMPTGYSFNLDGTSIYLSMCVIFIAQAYGVDLSLAQQLQILGILLLTSKGAAGVVGSGFIVLAATVSATGTLPMDGLALLLGIDRFMSSVRAMTNLIGNGVATVIIAKSEKEFHDSKAIAEYREYFKEPNLNKI